MYPQRALSLGCLEMYTHIYRIYTKFRAAAVPAQAKGRAWLFCINLYMFPNSPQGIEVAGDTNKAFQKLLLSYLDNRFKTYSCDAFLFSLNYHIIHIR